jgi:hypothetical protein
MSKLNVISIPSAMNRFDFPSIMVMTDINPYMPVGVTFKIRISLRPAKSFFLELLQSDDLTYRKVAFQGAVLL